MTKFHYNNRYYDITIINIIYIVEHLSNNRKYLTNFIEYSEFSGK